MTDFSKRIVVTGGNGFIGKYFVKSLLRDGHEVINIDKLTYASDKKMHAWLYEQPSYSFIHGDIATLESVPECDILVNFAAESHVDNSIRSSRYFTTANTIGVQNLLELVRRFDGPMRPIFVQISTDEVYGDNASGWFVETDPLRPSNPYAASKAAAETFLHAYARTYGVEFKIVRLSNNYGVRQYPEKLIPRSIFRIINGRKAQLHGSGEYRRTWLHVEDAIDGIKSVMDHGNINEIYNLSGDLELSNEEVLTRIIERLELVFSDVVEHVSNRPGQDIRYGINDSKARALDWKPKVDFDEALQEIIDQAKSDPHW